MWFDYLMSADFIVADANITVARLAAGLGISAAQYIHKAKNVEFRAAHVRVNPNLSYGATYIQLLARVPLAPAERRESSPLADNITAYGEHQGMQRPVVCHCTPLVTRRLPELRRLIDQRQLPYRLTPKFEYIWLGLSTQDPPRYFPEVDGGLCLEFASITNAAAASGDTSVEQGGMGIVPLVQQIAYPDVAPGTIVRLTARSHLVENIDACLASIRKSIDWPLESDVHVETCFGYKRAVIKPSMQTSAVIELLQPTSSDSRIGRAFSSFGAGPWSARLGVIGLSAKLDDLWSRGTEFQWQDPVNHRPRVVVDPAAVGGLRLELEELPGPDDRF